MTHTLQEHVLDALAALDQLHEWYRCAIDDLRQTNTAPQNQQHVMDAAERLDSAIDCMLQLQAHAADALEEAQDARARLELIAEATRTDVVDNEIDEAIESIETDGYAIVGDLLEDDADYVGQRLEAAGYVVDVKPDDDMGGITGLWIVRAEKGEEE